VAAPADQTFWAATASGPGVQQVNWNPTDGRWAVVIMNADGSAGITAAAAVEIQAGFLLPLALTLLLLGTLITAGAVILIVAGTVGGRKDMRNQTWPAARNMDRCRPDRASNGESSGCVDRPP
jgi:hypothetical protein